MEYTLIRAHKRTLSLQIGQDGVLIARAPYLMPKFLIDRFIAEKFHWIQKRRNDVAKPVAPKIEHFSDDQLKVFISKLLTKYSLSMSLRHSGVRFTTVKTYWGTCAPSGVLSFNMALRYAPPEAVAYVVVHELAHLRWKGHGRRFWDLVAKYYPKFKEARAILRSLSQNYRSG